MEDADILEEQARGRQLIVMGGQTFIYDSAVPYFKKLIVAGELRDVRYIYSQRLNLGRIRSDIDALWNFAPHDISIVKYWSSDVDPIAIQRSGSDFIQPRIDDVVFLNITYPNKILVNILVSPCIGSIRRKHERL